MRKEMKRRSLLRFLLSNLKNMVHVSRVFHPVGHGAFFTERFEESGQDDIIVVYDCGCKSREEEEILKQEVDDFFNDDEKISILFISHFDSDHVNGIKHLMPYLDNKTRLLMPFSYEYFYLKEDSPILYYMGQTLNLIESNGLSLKQYWVRYSANEHSDQLTDYRDLTGTMVESGASMGVLYSNEYQGFKWMYVPFNLYNDIYYKRQFEAGVLSELGKKAGELKATELDEIAITKLRSIYKKIGVHDTNTQVEATNAANGSKNINENSLIVLSKATSYECVQYFDAYLPLFTNTISLYRDVYDGSCLYTGDANLKNEKVRLKLKKLVDPYVKNHPIYLFQLSHHGSRQYYSKQLLSDDTLFTFLFVNCGFYDFRQKSFPKLIADIVATGRNMWMVTSKDYSRFEQIVILR